MRWTGQLTLWESLSWRSDSSGSTQINTRGTIRRLDITSIKHLLAFMSDRNKVMLNRLRKNAVQVVKASEKNHKNLVVFMFCYIYLYTFTYEDFWTPNRASSQFDEILRTIFAKQSFAQLSTNYIRRILLWSRTNVRPIKNGLKALGW